MHVLNLPYAYGKPTATAKLKQHNHDFIVEEQIAFELSGEGEHLWVWLEKEGENTDWAAQQLAKWAGIRLRDIGYAGLKDRHAVTRQWFSLYLPGRADPDLQDFVFDTMRIVKSIRHKRKLQTGGLSGNRFILTLSEVKGDRAELEARLENIKHLGVPNYFGEQRFGRNEHNLVMAQRLFNGELTRLKPAQRGLYISSARSYLFNLILAERVNQACWNKALTGDVFQLEGSDKWFVDDAEERLAQRVTECDIHPTGALVGTGDLPSMSEVKALEQKVLLKHQAWLEALEALGLKQDRRALRVIPKDMTWRWLGSDRLELAFSLRPGAYATMVVREGANV
ncbi:tRNA pseudouridine(13) synthase TruD [Thiomicrospira microaerophila]|uniref:tRNA pseudouridine(13) synthase TruD n=1 Tax=Thiomicrospira microaerophila TaxID=406020 RepID=UPI00200C90B1|nr:tRNA pseudouridine(13) synthase TruD [Thiomicrospira microaerophila]UQB42474.1 tRNA pseudouridine(13) synthase TruD [Thiomicrospira microaerophila]